MRAAKSKIFISMLLIMISALLTSPTCAQGTVDTTKVQFHDDLLDHLVGKWNVTSIAHGEPFTADLEASWVLNHQYLLIHFMSREIIPWWGAPMEYYEYIGYNHYKQRYTFHGMSIEGDEDPSEGFGYGYRDGNDFKTVAKYGDDKQGVQHIIWQPESNTWLIQSREESNGKESEVFLEMKLTAVKPTPK